MVEWMVEHVSKDQVREVGREVVYWLIEIHAKAFIRPK